MIIRLVFILFCIKTLRRLVGLAAFSPIRPPPPSSSHHSTAFLSSPTVAALRRGKCRIIIHKRSVHDFTYCSLCEQKPQALASRVLTAYNRT